MKTKLKLNVTSRKKHLRSHDCSVFAHSQGVSNEERMNELCRSLSR